MEFFQCRAARAGLSRDLRSVLRPLTGGLRGKWSPLVLALTAAVLVCGTQRPAAAQFAQQGGKLTANDETGSAQFGNAVALSANGNTAIVGGPRDDSFAGAAWIFTRSGNSWSQQGSKLVGTGATGSSQRGVSVALSNDGNTALVGGYVDNSYAGAVWVFTRDGNGNWTQQGLKLTPNDGDATSDFGSSVALSADGNTAAIGGYFDNSAVGALWIFVRDSNGNWTQQGSKLTANDETGNARLGSSVAISADGNTAVTGGYLDSTDAGAVWVFTRSGTTWSQQGTKLVGSGGSAANQGTSVAMSADGNTIASGGETDEVGGKLTGATWIFTRSGSTWSQQGNKLVGTGAVDGPGAEQGFSVALSGDGNTLIESGGTDDSRNGAIWVFTRSGTTWSQQGNKLVGTGNSGAGLQGHAVALSRDGGTMIEGAIGDNGNIGAAWVFIQPFTIAVSASPAAGGTVTGGGSFDPGTSHTVIATANAGYRFVNWTEGGNAVSTSASYTFTVSGARTLVANFTRNAGHDFDGNGKDDILWHHSGGDVAVWLMNGTSATSTVDIGNVPAAWQIAGTSSLVRSTGDFDGDGKADFLWRHTGGDVSIWEMNGTTPKLTVDIGNVPNAWQIAGVGDFDGDGKADILWRHSGGDVAVWLMNGTTPKSSLDIGNVPTAWQIAGVGDFDGDGKADILWRHTGGDVAIWEMNGTATKLAVDIGNVPTAWQIAGVADFDGDGKADFLWRHSGGDFAVWLMNGTTPKSSLDIGNVPNAWQIVSTGDYDGDGKGDILWRHSGGDVAIWEMNGTTPKLAVDIGNVPTAWTVVE